MMMRLGAVVAFSLLAACGGVESNIDAAVQHDAPVADASIDAATPRCNPTATFKQPVALAGLATSGTENIARMMPDELTAFLSGQLGASTSVDLFVATRANLAGSFGMPTRLSISDANAADYDPTVSSDGLTIIFDSSRGGGGPRRLYVATRTSTLGDFQGVTLVSNVGSPVTTDNDIEPFLTADGAELWFSSQRTGGLGGYDIWKASKSGNSFGSATAVTAISSASLDFAPMLSADRLAVYFTTDRGGNNDIWRATRSTVNDGFGTPAVVTELNTNMTEFAGWLSADNCRLYINRNGEVMIATRDP